MNDEYYPSLPEGYGVVRQNPLDVYKWCKDRNKSFLIVRNGTPYDKTRYLDEVFNSIDQAIHVARLKKEFVTNPYDALLYFLKVHQSYHRIYEQTGFRNNSDKEKRFWPADVICIEITSYLPAQVEYIIMMYRYLYSRGVRMPQFYVIVDYPTNVFSFISTDIFDRVDPPWTQPISDSRLPTSPLVLQKYNEQLIMSSVHVVVSSNGMYENKIKQNLNKPHLIFQDIVSYLNTTKNNDLPSIVLVNTVEDLLYWRERFPVDEDKDFRPNLVILDMGIKVPKNTMYTGNHLSSALPNEDYQKSIYRKVLSLPYEPKVEVYYEDASKPVVIRGIFEISPIVDIVLFLKYNVKFSSLYSNYQKQGSTRSFGTVVRADTELLAELNIDKKLEVSHQKHLDQKEIVIRFGVHPILVSIVQKWFERGWPRFSILIFIAVVTTSSGKAIEIREPGTREYDNDISQTSRYGQILFEFLKLCAVTGSPYPDSEVYGRTSKLLLRLSELYGTLGEEYLPDHNEFHMHLVKLLSSDFKPYILHRLRHSIYRASYSSQRNWTISQTAQAPEYLFPLSVVPSSTNMYVPLFVPIDRMV
jgi:hypothetical protein